VIGNIIFIIVTLAFSLPSLYFGIVTIKELPAYGIQLILCALIMLGIAAKIVGV